ncbi:MAG: N-acetylmuramic acid 6-phosphate etherase [Actinomycetota bacterium]
MKNERELDLDRLVTEDQHEDFVNLDLMMTAEIVRVMNGEDARVPTAVAAVRPQIVAAIDGIAERLTRGGRLIYVGAGTPGRLAVLDASECGPTFNAAPEQVQAVLAGGERAMANAYEGAEDDAQAGAADLSERSVGADDCVVGISASGRTPYVLGALEHARAAGALTVGLACNPGSPIAHEADLPIEIVTGPEVISGSTRLKAGTAQKLVLNMISTIVMVRLGRTFGNLMVDVRASNEKLRLRSLRIVRLATSCSVEEARRALAAANGEAKVAILMLLTGDDPATAAEILRRHDGHLRKALEASS